MPVNLCNFIYLYQYFNFVLPSLQQGTNIVWFYRLTNIFIIKSIKNRPKNLHDLYTELWMFYMLFCTRCTLFSEDRMG